MAYQLEESVVPFCQGKWDTEKNKFVPASSAEILDCCLDSCKAHPQFCFETCDKLYQNETKNDCYQQCNELAKDCQDACYSVPSQGTNIMDGCASMCGSWPEFDSNCLDQRKDQIIDCCKKICSQDSGIDCNLGESCPDIFNFIQKVSKDTYSDLREIVPVNKKDKSNKIIFYIFLVIIAVLIVKIIFF